MHFDNFVTHKNKSSGLNEQSQTHTCIMIFRVKAFLTLIALTSAAAANAVKYCDGVASVTVVSSTAANADDMEQSFELYRTLLGGNNNGSDPPAVSGHRQVNWDAPIVPFDMPGDFFAATVPRGLLLNSVSNEFRVSNDVAVTDNLFNSINPEASANFQTRSPQRLFTSVGENEFTIQFSIPGTVDKPATVQGFGGVFVDVNDHDATKMTFYAESGCVLAEEVVKSAPGGLTFLGVFVGEATPKIYNIKVKLGSQALDSNEPQRQCQGFFCFFSFLFGGLFGANNDNIEDFVVMDDFLYSEPQAI